MTIKAIVYRLFARKKSENTHTHKVDNIVITYDWNNKVRHIYTVNHDGRTIHHAQMMDRFGNWN